MPNRKERYIVWSFLDFILYIYAFYGVFHALGAKIWFDSEKLISAYSAVMSIVFCLCAFNSWRVKKIINEPKLEFRRLKRRMILIFVVNIAASAVSIVEAVLLGRLIWFDPSFADYRNLVVIGFFMLIFMTVSLVFYCLPFLILLLWQLIVSCKALAPLGEAEFSGGDCSISVDALSTSEPIDRGSEQQAAESNSQSRDPHEGYQFAPGPFGTAC